MKNLICSISLLIAQYWNIFGCGQREVSRTRTRCNRIDPRQLHFHGANKVKNCPSTCFLSEGHVAQGGREGGRPRGEGCNFHWKWRLLWRRGYFFSIEFYDELQSRNVTEQPPEEKEEKEEKDKEPVCKYEFFAPLMAHSRRRLLAMSAMPARPRPATKCVLPSSSVRQQH